MVFIMSATLYNGDDNLRSLTQNCPIAFLYNSFCKMVFWILTNSFVPEYVFNNSHFDWSKQEPERGCILVYDQLPLRYMSERSISIPYERLHFPEPLLPYFIIYSNAYIT